jgi:LPS export ABC transporter permease LptF
MILHRYILRQILWPVLAAFLSLNLLFLVVQLLKVAEVAVGAGFRITDLVRIVVLFLPGFSVLIIPVSVLTGILLGFGRMALDGELTALASAGVSSRRLMVMPLALGAMASLLAFLVSGFLAPASTDALYQTFMNLSKRHVAASLQPGRFFEEVPGVVLYPDKPGSQDGELDGFLMHDRRSDQARRILVAKKASVRPLEHDNYLELEFLDGQVHHFGRGPRPYSIGRFDKASIGIDIDRLVYDRTRFIPAAERLSSAELLMSARDPELTERERKQRISAFHRRAAFPVAALLFATLGCALGAAGRLKGRRRSLLGAMVVVTGYYLLMRLGDAVVDQGWLMPAPAAWLPDLLMAGIAAWLVARMGRAGR